MYGLFHDRLDVLCGLDHLAVLVEPVDFFRSVLVRHGCRLLSEVRVGFRPHALHLPALQADLEVDVVLAVVDAQALRDVALVLYPIERGRARIAALGTHLQDSFALAVLARLHKLLLRKGRVAILCVIMIPTPFQSVTRVDQSAWAHTPKYLCRAVVGDLLHIGELTERRGGLLKIRRTGSFISITADQAWKGAPIPWPRSEDGVKEIIIEPGTGAVQFIPIDRAEIHASEGPSSESPAF